MNIDASRLLNHKVSPTSQIRAGVGVGARARVGVGVGPVPFVRHGGCERTLGMGTRPSISSTFSSGNALASEPWSDHPCPEGEDRSLSRVQ